jgi:hypothetical protein
MEVSTRTRPRSGREGCQNGIPRLNRGFETLQGFRCGLPNWLFYLLAFSVILDIILRTDPHDHVVKYCSCGKPLPSFAVATRDPWCSSGCARKAFGVTIQPGATSTAALKPGERTRLQQLRMQVAEARRERVLEEAEKYVSESVSGSAGSVLAGCAVAQSDVKVSGRCEGAPARDE